MKSSLHTSSLSATTLALVALSIAGPVGDLTFPDGSTQRSASYGPAIAARARFANGNYEIANRPLLVDATNPVSNASTTQVDGTLWQSFTAVGTGTVAGIDVTRAETVSDVILRVYEGTGTGGTLLAEGIVSGKPGFLLDQYVGTSFPGGFEIVAGSAYTISLTGNDVGWTYATGDPYAGGSSSNMDWDFEFRVWVLDPADNGVLDAAVVVEHDTGHVGMGVENPSHPLHMASGAHVTAGGVWTNASSRELKENFTAIDVRQILAKVRALELTRWNYRTEDDAVVHLGPIAEEFRAAFGLGANAVSIATIDANGVALASIQALADELNERDERLGELEAELDELRRAVRAMTSRNE